MNAEDLVDRALAGDPDSARLAWIEIGARAEQGMPLPSELLRYLAAAAPVLAGEPVEGYRVADYGGIGRSESDTEVLDRIRRFLGLTRQGRPEIHKAERKATLQFMASALLRDRLSLYEDARRRSPRTQGGRALKAELKAEQVEALAEVGEDRDAVLRRMKLDTPEAIGERARADVERQMVESLGCDVRSLRRAMEAGQEPSE
jgi:hypothetical protein